MPPAEPATGELRVELAMRVGQLDLEVRLRAPAGRCLALVGRSGAGKTTILRCIAGTVTPARGVVSCGARVWLDTARRVCEPPERRRCGLLVQDYALFPHLSVWRNVAYGLHELPRPARHDRAIELLERFGVADLADARPASLSGGERQRVALARAIAPQPAVLLLDEPLSALDAHTRSRATDVIARLRRNRLGAIVLVTHDFRDAVLLADEVAVIERGRIVQRGSPADLLAAPACGLVAELIGSAQPPM